MRYRVSDKNHVAARASVPNMAKFSSYAPVSELVRRDLVRNISELLSHEKIKTIEGDFVTEYRLELYVFTPDEFYQAVQAEAQEMMRWFDRAPALLATPYPTGKEGVKQ